MSTILCVNYEGFIRIPFYLSVILLIYLILKSRELKFAFKFRERALFVLLATLTACYAAFYVNKMDESSTDSILNYQSDKLEVVGVVAKRNDFFGLTQLILKSLIVSSEDGVSLLCSGRLEVIYQNQYLPDIEGIEVGDTIKGNFKIAYPDVPKNFYDQDFRLTGLVDGIHAVAWPSRDHETTVIYSSKRLSVQLANNLRKLIKNSVKQFISPQGIGVLSALLMGDKSSFDSNLYENFASTGVSHLFSVSGFHVSYVFFLANAILSAMYIKKRVLNSTISLLLVYIYACACGMGNSVIRAFIYICISIVASGLKIKPNRLNLFMVSLVVHLFINPMAIFNTGFVLSYLAFGALIYLNPVIAYYIDEFVDSRCKFKFKKFFALFLKGVSTTLLLQIIALPVLSSFNNKAFIFSAILNLLLLPLTAVVMPVAIIGCLLSPIRPVAFLIFKGLDVMVRFMIFLVQTASSLKFAFLKIPAFKSLSSFIYIMVFFGVIFLIRNPIFIFKIKHAAFKIFKGKHIRYAVLAFSILMCTIFATNKLITLSIYFINVGNGDACLIRSSIIGNILIDAGGGQRREDSANEVVYNFLNKLGVNYLNIVIMTHGHEDHAFGLVKIMDNIKIRHLLISPYEPINKLSEELMEMAMHRKINITKVSSGMVFSLRSLRFEVLNPSEGRILSENDTSLVVKFIYRNFKAIFEADAEKVSENELIKYDVFDCDLLKVAHHGSKTSSKSELIEAISPDYAVVSVGKNNYGHPAEEVLERLESSGAKVFCTDTSGTVIVKYRFGRVFVKTLSSCLRNLPLFRRIPVRLQN